MITNNVAESLDLGMPEHSEKPGVRIDVPHFGSFHIKRVISDYTGTHSLDGKLTPGVIQRLRALHRLVDIDIVTSDSFGMAERELSKVPLTPRILSNTDVPADHQKKEIALQHDLRGVAAFGNGRNDRLLLEAAKQGGGLAIAVDNGEGCALDALLSAHIFITGSENALDLLLNATRLKATLRL
jgi:soluble P-type ATPase